MHLGIMAELVFFRFSSSSSPACLPRHLLCLCGGAQPRPPGSASRCPRTPGTCCCGRWPHTNRPEHRSEDTPTLPANACCPPSAIKTLRGCPVSPSTCSRLRVIFRPARTRLSRSARQQLPSVRAQTLLRPLAGRLTLKGCRRRWRRGLTSPLPVWPPLATAGRLRGSASVVAVTIPPLSGLMATVASGEVRCQRPVSPARGCPVLSSRLRQSTHTPPNSQLPRLLSRAPNQCTSRRTLPVSPGFCPDPPPLDFSSRSGAARELRAWSRDGAAGGDGPGGRREQPRSGSFDRAVEAKAEPEGLLLCRDAEESPELQRTSWALSGPSGSPWRRADDGDEARTN